ncbi:BglG family transcription antiterminator [Terribacillus saccharophilus]|uniref:Transcription antiterminator BglG n=2 Tax=Terribacillus saccharophilus TaxID=361277 RepID=A0A268ABA1_9BACI|nr:PTS sugar transporter subunit IIA [Terribacillus saccharophilus]PAD21411.1 transcription antiterminator BglG [Terribacillus saccharophilus]
MKERTRKLLTRFSSVNSFLTYEDLSKEFSISERTVRNELVLINNYLTEKNYPTIMTARGKGLKLTLSDKEREKLLLRIGDDRETDYYRPDERFLALLLDIVNPSNTTILYEMEKKLLVSKSTLDEDMRKLRFYLKDHDISVVSLPKQGVVLQGDERSIRSMLYGVITSMTDIDNLMSFQNTEAAIPILDQLVLSYLDLEVLQIISKNYDEILEKSMVEINYVYRNQVILFLGIWIRRLQEGNILYESVKSHNWIKDCPTETFVDGICKEFDLELPLNECEYITQTIESFNPKDMNNSVDWITAQLLAIQLIEHVEKLTGIPFSQREEDLYEGLYKHITGLLSRAKNNIQASNPLKETIKDSYAEIYQAVTCFKRQIEDYTKKPLSEDEIGFLTVYFSTSASWMKQEQRYVFQAIVLCNHGISTGKLLAANLKEHFNIDIVAVLSSHELAFIDKLDVDLVFTTIPIDYQKKPLLVLNPILRESDKKEIKEFLLKNKNKRRIISNKFDATSLMQDVLALIIESGGRITKESYQRVEETFKEHHLKINTREIQPMLQDILKQSNILLNQECGDWKEAITKVAEILVSDAVIEESYITAMIKSVEEFGPYIVVGKHLALAHARPEDGVNKLGISVLTLKNPVYFGNPDNDPVRIVFCLAAVDSYSHLNVMKNLIDLINDEEKVNRLIAVQDIDMFNNVLYGSEKNKLEEERFS